MSACSPVALIGTALLLGNSLFAAESPAPPCRVEVVEAGSGWPVPLVELRTTHQARWVTDNAGVIALDAPELMHRETWFDVHGHGYERPRDGFGYRGIRLTPTPGGRLRVEVNRTIVARRLGRITGAGIFAESQRLGSEPGWKESGVFGQDSVQNAVYGGQLFWLWGDTTLAGYPLGIFASTAATSPVRPLKSLEPPVRLELDYFRKPGGALRGVAPMPGEGPTWIAAMTTVPDRAGKEHLVASYMKVKPPLEAYERGLCQWNPERREFEPVRRIWTRQPGETNEALLPDGHAVRWTDAAKREWVLFGNPLPVLRCPATFEAWQDPSTWERLVPQAMLQAGGTTNRVRPHTGAIAWNGYRKRWVTVFMEAFGKPSAFGELWYAEAREPAGPWGPAVKVVSHDNYTFYNPQLHPEFTPEGSPVLIFEGTYTAEFANKPERTPRYDYNQILYRLDLDDPALQAAEGP
jgi:hypothetical protein